MAPTGSDFWKQASSAEEQELWGLRWPELQPGKPSGSIPCTLPLARWHRDLHCSGCTGWLHGQVSTAEKWQLSAVTGGFLEEQCGEPSPGWRLAAGLPLLGCNSSIPTASSENNVMKIVFFSPLSFLFFFFPLLILFYWATAYRAESLFWLMSSCNIITRAQRKSPLEISNPNRPLFYLQLFEYMTSDNPVVNCVPNSNCSHGNFKYREGFPACLQREDVEFLALFGSDGARKPGCAHGSTSPEPQWHHRATEFSSAAGSCSV